jgi:RNA polymerase sigma factor (sigma-70 family)
MAAPDLWRTAVHGLVPAMAEVPDAELLRRFRTCRDEAAFELLVYRHGPLVWAACRRMLRDHHAAEDAFQATFLALARQAASIRAGRSVPAWLHRVAVRAGIHLRRRNRRALLPLGDDVIDPARSPTDMAGDRETAAHIDAAINALSDRLRNVFILCELHGYSLADAAARLGVPIGTVASRLGRARERLRKVLSVRGLAVGSGLLTTDVVPPTLRGASVRMAAGGTKVTPMVMALSRRAAGPTMRAPMFGLACSIAAGLAAVAIALGGQDPPPSTPKPTAREAPPAVSVRADAEGVLLPDGAVARLGSNRFRHNGQPVASVVFSPDGRLVACPHNRGAVSVFEVATGRSLFRFRVPEKHYPSAARFLADGKRLAVGSMEYRAAELTVYSLSDGKPTATSRFETTSDGTAGYIKVIDVTADGSRVLVDDLWGRGIYLRDLKSGKDVWQFEASEVVYTRPFTADGKWFALAGNSKVELRNAATGETAAVFPDPGPSFKDRYNATLTHDGRVLVISKDYDALAVLDPKGAVAVRTFPAGDRGLVRGLISPDGRYLVGLGQIVSQVWDLAAKAGRGPIARLPGAWSGGFSPDGKTIALDNDGIVTLVGTGDWKTLPQSADPPSGVYPVRFALDGKRVVGHTSAGWLSWPAAGGPPDRPTADNARHWSRQSDVSADGRVAIETVSVPGETPGQWTVAFQVTNLQTGATHRILREGSFLVRPQLSSDGRFMTADVNYPEFAVWDLTTGKVVHRRAGSPKESVLAALPAADGTGFAVSAVAVRGDDPGLIPGRPYASLTVTDHRTGRAVKLDPPPSAAAAEFSPDGSRLVLQTGAGDRGILGPGDVSVWDSRTGRRLMTWPRPAGIPGLRDAVADSVALSADNRALLVGDAAGLLSLVEVATGKERASFGHTGGVVSVAFHPDGTKAVSSGREDPVYVWNLLGDPGRWDSNKADAVWADLASSDAKSAFAAVRKLRANPAEAITFLKDRVKVPAVPADDTVAAWLKALDAPAFADREKAQRELTAVAGLIRPKLEAARKSASAEAGRRLDQVLKALDERVTPDGFREIRACEVLEGIRSPEAVRVLKAWAGGPGGYRLTIEATESLERLNK